MTQIDSCPICGNNQLKFKLQPEDHTVSHEKFSLRWCNNCDFLITSPRPDNDDLTKYYQSDNYISHTSKGTDITNKLYLIARQFTLRSKLRLINSYSNQGTLLDYGCCTGHFLKFASSRGWTTMGVEPSQQARQYADNNNQIYSQLDNIGLKKFDVITLWHVLEHIDDLNGILQKLSTRLTKSGTIFIAVPNFKSFDAEYYRELWAGYDVPRHLWHFSKKAMTILLQKHSLKVITVRPMLLDGIYVGQLSEKYKRDNRFRLIDLLNGTIIGLRSNISALSSKEYSSLIYVIKK